MKKRTITEATKAFGVKQALKYMDRNPDENIPKILGWLESYDKNGQLTPQLHSVRQAIEDKENNWYKLVKSLWTDIDSGVRRRLFENFVIHENIIGSRRQEQAREKYRCNIPWAILMDPTSACNLHCTGCWAADYGDKLNLSLDELDRIIWQGKMLGTYFYLYSGGEPLIRRKDIVRLCERHPECVFLAFTNGTLIDEAFADEMLRVQNFVPAISIEGFEEATDSRRGKGTYQKVIEAMKLLKRKKLPFGISLCYTAANTEVIGSDAYIDEMIALGAKFAWFFTYIPIGEGADTGLIATAVQRRLMYRKIRTWRNEKPIFTLDFWNDGEFAGGCIAGGRSYLHINANGDIEPCAFIHYADSNIRTHTILDACRRPLFMEYRRNQPFNGNMLRPCPLLDNAGKLAEMVDQTGAKSTDFRHPEDAHALCAKCKQAAQRWAPVADALWNTSQYALKARLEKTSGG